MSRSTRLNPLDAAWLFTESRATPNHVGGLLIFKLPEGAPRDFVCVDDVVAANWDSLVFDIGRDPLRRVPMMEPLRGTADHVGTLIEQRTDTTQTGSG